MSSYCRHKSVFGTQSTVHIKYSSLHTEEYLEVRDLAGTVIKPQTQFPQHINFISYLGIKSSETLKYTRSKTT